MSSDLSGEITAIATAVLAAFAIFGLEEQRSEKYRQGLIGVVSIGVRAGQLGRTDAWLWSHLVSHA